MHFAGKSEQSQEGDTALLRHLLLQGTGASPATAASQQHPAGLDLSRSNAAVAAAEQLQATVSAQISPTPAAGGAAESNTGSAGKEATMADTAAAVDDAAVTARRSGARSLLSQDPTWHR